MFLYQFDPCFEQGLVSGYSREYQNDHARYDYRFRAQDPGLGVFIQRDPIGIWGDKLNYGNGYSCFAQDPLNWTDPMGMFPDAPRGLTRSGGVLGSAQNAKSEARRKVMDDCKKYCQNANDGDTDCPRKDDENNARCWRMESSPIIDPSYDPYKDLPKGYYWEKVILHWEFADENYLHLGCGDEKQSLGGKVYNWSVTGEFANGPWKLGATIDGTIGQGKEVHSPTGIENIYKGMVLVKSAERRGLQWKTMTFTDTFKTGVADICACARKCPNIGPTEPPAAPKRTAKVGGIGSPR